MSLFGARYAVEILAVCTANICRSPMAESLLREELKLRKLEDRVNVMSAGTHVPRPGHAADGRARKACARRGIDLRRCRSRQVVEGDFKRFHYILAMDERNYQWLQDASPVARRGNISLIGNWAEGGPVGEIPDPYYGSPAGFEDVLSQLQLCVNGFLDRLLSDGLPGKE